MSWASAKLKSEVIGIWVGILSVLAGGGYAIWEYGQHKAAEAAKEAMSYVQRSQQAPIFDAQLKISGVWNAKDAMMKEVASKGEDAYRQFLLGTIRDEKLEPHVFSLLGFYEALATCSRRGWCDEDIAKSFFCSSARRFLRTHYQFITDRREQWKQGELGKETESFVKRCGAASA